LDSIPERDLRAERRNEKHAAAAMVLREPITTAEKHTSMLPTDQVKNGDINFYYR
jgi:hypothetical protein